MRKNQPKCVICSASSRFWSAVPPYRGSQQATSKSQRGTKVFNLYKCDRCGHGFFYPGVRGQKELDRFYDEGYAHDYHPDVKNESFVKRHKQYRLDVSHIQDFLPAGNISVLDFGCATGQFLNAMPDHWRKNGFEVNKFEIEYVKKNYGNIRILSDIRQLPKQTFDLITLRGVIEHLFDFNNLFSVIEESLKKGGMVYICATPDFNSPCSVVYKAQWNQIGAPLHYHQFTAASLAILFAKHHFGLKVLRYDYLDTPYEHFEDDASKFVDNVNSALKNQTLRATDHAYPGTMITMLFKDIKGISQDAQYAGISQNVLSETPAV